MEEEKIPLLRHEELHHRLQDQLQTEVKGYTELKGGSRGKQYTSPVFFQIDDLVGTLKDKEDITDDDRQRASKLLTTKDIDYNALTADEKDVVLDLINQVYGAEYMVDASRNVSWIPSIPAMYNFMDQAPMLIRGALPHTEIRPSDFQQLQIEGDNFLKAIRRPYVIDLSVLKLKETKDIPLTLYVYKLKKTRYDVTLLSTRYVATFLYIGDKKVYVMPKEFDPDEDVVYRIFSFYNEHGDRSLFEDHLTDEELEKLNRDLLSMKPSYPFPFFQDARDRYITEYLERITGRIVADIVSDTALMQASDEVQLKEFMERFSIYMYVLGMGTKYPVPVTEDGWNSICVGLLLDSPESYDLNGFLTFIRKLQQQSIETIFSNMTKVTDTIEFHKQVIGILKKIRASYKKSIDTIEYAAILGISYNQYNDLMISSISDETTRDPLFRLSIPNHLAFEDYFRSQDFQDISGHYSELLKEYQQRLQRVVPEGLKRYPTYDKAFRNGLLYEGAGKMLQRMSQQVNDYFRSDEYKTLRNDAMKLQKQNAQRLRELIDATKPEYISKVTRLLDTIEPVESVSTQVVHRFQVKLETFDREINQGLSSYILYRLEGFTDQVRKKITPEVAGLVITLVLFIMLAVHLQPMERYTSNNKIDNPKMVVMDSPVSITQLSGIPFVGVESPSAQIRMIPILNSMLNTITPGCSLANMIMTNIALSGYYSKNGVALEMSSTKNKQFHQTIASTIPDQILNTEMMFCPLPSNRKLHNILYVAILGLFIVIIFVLLFFLYM